MEQTLHISRVGEGLPLVFIHGWGVNSAIWQPVVDTLADNYEITTIDLPGFGDNNEFVLDEYTVSNIAKLIASRLDKPAVIIGWSLGGLIATELALQWPNKVKSLVTVASSPFFVEEGSYWLGIKPDVLKSFHQQLVDDPVKTIKGFLRIQAMGSPQIRQDIKLITQLVMTKPMANQQVLDKSLSLLETVDYRERLKEVSQPFLRLYGRLDGLVPNKVITRINDISPESSQHVIFQQSSHAPFISQPHEFIETLSLWLKSNQ